ncbi:WXG100 family type VII secretion target [Cohnella sp. GCM10027633]|uniref:WXG100 family type VII secretion target n=1 Tax=unclassified Cohnella TaxID=2636738 RepID=UPI00364016FE
MAKKIVVDPAKLESAAGKMEEQSREYEQLYSQLFNAVDGLGSAWKGKDNVAFCERIREFKPDMDTMKKNMDLYADFLKKSAKQYQTTQDTIEANAKKLAN